MKRRLNDWGMSWRISFSEQMLILGQLPCIRYLCRLVRQASNTFISFQSSHVYLGYSDEKVARLTKEAVAQGFNHFKMKVGADQADDLRRGKLIRSIIDDPQYLPPGAAPRDPNSEALRGKNAGPTGSVLMIDANQVWDVQQAIDYVKGLEDIKPW